MSKTTGLDRAVEYVQKLEKFRQAFEAGHSKHIKGEKAQVETGRKFDKVFINTGVQKLGRYMVDRNSWVIYGINSWQQVNERRVYGTLDTIEQWNWEPYYASPVAGTQAEKDHAAREVEIAKQHKPRGRPRKTA
jgi:hypothetical protein